MLKKDITPSFKRPETNWMKFVKEYYQLHKEGEPGLRKFLPRAALEWKEMTDEQKAVRQLIILDLHFLMCFGGVPRRDWYSFQAYAVPKAEWDEYFTKLKEWRANLPRNIRLAIRRKRKDYHSGQKQPLNPWFQSVIL